MTLAALVSVAYGVVIATLFAFGANGYFLLLRRRRWRPAEPRRDAPRWPHVVVQLPVYNERDVVERALRAAAALRYPGPLEIQLLDDSDDDTPTIAAGVIAELRRGEVAIAHVRRGSREGFKAGALAHAMDLTNAEVFVIFDADFVPEPDFLTETVPLLAPDDVAGVQTRWGHLNRETGPLTRGQALGIDLHFFVEQRARMASGWVVAFNGSGGMWKRQAIVAAGGWSADTLTEDLDLSYRAWLAGWRVVYADAVECPAEIPEGMLAFKAQQRRWARGSTSTARKLLGRVWRSDRPFGAKLQATLHLTHYGVHPLMLASAFMVVPLALVVPGPSPWWHVLPPLAMATGGVLTMAFVAGRERGLRRGRIARDLVAMTVLGTGLSVSNTVAVFKGLRLQPAVFERTAKGGGGTSSYLTSGGGLAYVELASALICAGTAVWLLGRGIYTFVPFLLLYMTGLGVVGATTLRENLAAARAARRPAAAVPTGTSAGRAVAGHAAVPGGGGVR